jgi:uncharacterized protein
MTVGSDMKNPYIIPAAMICATILAGFWMLKSPSEPQKVIVVRPPDISIIQAITNGNIEAIKQHIAAGTDVNAKAEKGGASFFGGTPLHEAAAYQRKDIIELLIAAGADVNTKTDGGLTPLDVAKSDTLAPDDRGTAADLLRKHGGKTGEGK